MLLPTCRSGLELCKQSTSLEITTGARLSTGGRCGWRRLSGAPCTDYACRSWPTGHGDRTCVRAPCLAYIGRMSRRCLYCSECFYGLHFCAPVKIFLSPVSIDSVGSPKLGALPPLVGGQIARTVKVKRKIWGNRTHNIHGSRSSAVRTSTSKGDPAMSLSMAREYKIWYCNIHPNYWTTRVYPRNLRTSDNRSLT